MQTRNHSSPINDSAAALEKHWRRFGVHRASQQAELLTCATGWPALDAILPGGGYPLGAVTEFLVQQPGQGELSLLLHSLKARLEADPDSRLAFINPPYRLNAPALDAARIDRARVPVIQCTNTGERIWSIEQLAAAGGFAGFVLWDSALDGPALRRLQLAGEKAACPVFAYRDIRCARQRSPAALRLALTCRDGRQRLEILKCRGPAGARIDGLKIDRDLPWLWPALQKPAFVPQPADNDSQSVDLQSGGSSGFRLSETQSFLCQPEAGTRSSVSGKDRSGEVAGPTASAALECSRGDKPCYSRIR